ncbi:MAG: CHAT domain-containing protein [Spirochaetes bacterium]|nr:CHAT domain-containing protein [Spirochaetota bacterium]
MGYIVCTDMKNLVKSLEHRLVRVPRTLRGLYDLVRVKKGERVFLLDHEHDRLYGPFVACCDEMQEEINPKEGPFNGFGPVENHYRYDSIPVDCGSVGREGVQYRGGVPWKIPFFLEPKEEERITRSLLIMNTKRLPVVINFTLNDGVLRAALVTTEKETAVRNHTFGDTDAFSTLVERKMRIAEEVLGRDPKRACAENLRELGELVFDNMLEPLALGPLFSEGGFLVCIGGDPAARRIPFEISWSGSFIFEKNSVFFTRQVREDLQKNVRHRQKRAATVQGELSNEDRRDRPTALIIADPARRCTHAYEEGVELFNLFEREGIAVDLVSRPVDREHALGLLSGYEFVHFCGHMESEGPSQGWDLGDFRLRVKELPELPGFPSFVFSSSCSGTMDFGQKLLDRGASTVVCSRWRVPDRDMRGFVIPFYRLLLDGAETGEAFNYAVRTSYERGDVAPLLFSLHGNGRKRYEKLYK